MFGFGKHKNSICNECENVCKATHPRGACPLFKKKAQVVLEVTVYRTGDDLQYVTMHINDWYKIMRELKTPIRNKWGVKHGKR